MDLIVGRLRDLRAHGRIREQAEMNWWNNPPGVRVYQIPSEEEGAVPLINGHTGTVPTAQRCERSPPITYRWLTSNLVKEASLKWAKAIFTGPR